MVLDFERVGMKGQGDGVGFFGELGHNKHQGGSVRVWPVLQPVEFFAAAVGFREVQYAFQSRSLGG